MWSLWVKSLSANSAKWSNTLKQFVGNNFRLALKELSLNLWYKLFDVCFMYVAMNVVYSSFSACSWNYCLWAFMLFVFNIFGLRFHLRLYCMLSCHVCVSEWICTGQLPKCQGTPCSKQGWSLKFKWQQRNSNPQQLSL